MAKKTTAKKKKKKKKTGAAGVLAPKTLPKRQVILFVYQFFDNRSKFPPGTTTENWIDVKMSDMLFDQPPLPANPHFEKKKLSKEMQAWFSEMKLKLKSPLTLLKTNSKTMKDLWKFCYENQSVM